MASSAPPTWVFAGDIPDEHKAALREEMERARGFFADTLGVEATGFTVLVGMNHEVHAASAYMGLTGQDSILGSLPRPNAVWDARLGHVTPGQRRRS